MTGSSTVATTASETASVTQHESRSGSDDFRDESAEYGDVEHFIVDHFIVDHVHLELVLIDHDVNHGPRCFYIDNDLDKHYDTLALVLKTQR